MKKINLLAITIALLFILCGCSVWNEENHIAANDEPISSTGEKVSLQTEGNILKSAGKHKRNFSGQLKVWSDPIPPGSELFLEVEGNGILTHMGKSSLSMKKTIRTYRYPDPPGPWEAVAELVLTTANGDELYFSYDFCTIDRSNSPDFTFIANCTITGGTGRYADASGNIDYFETFSWAEAKGILQLTGSVTF